MHAALAQRRKLASQPIFLDLQSEIMSSLATRRDREVAAVLRELQFSCWPLRDDGIWAWLALIGGGAVATGVGLGAQSLLLGILAALALNVSLWRIWMPVEYEIGPGGLIETVLGRRRRISWRLIGAYEISGRSVRLYPKAGSARLFASRSLYLRGGRHHSELCQLVEFYLTPRRRV